MHMSAKPSVPRRLHCRYIFYALYTNHTHLPKRDAGKFREWEFCTNPRPTTFHITTSTSNHITHRWPPSPPIDKHHAPQHPLLKATTTHQRTQLATTSGHEPTSTHTSLTGATLLTAMWQLNDERRPKIVIRHFSHPFLGIYEVVQFFDLGYLKGTHSGGWYMAPYPFHGILG